MRDSVTAIQKYFARLEGDKQRLLNVFQEVGDYCLPRKATFNNNSSPNLPGYAGKVVLYDQTAERAAELSCSALLGMLWPEASRSFVLRPPKDMELTDEVLAWYNHVNEQMYKYMDLPESGLAIALQEIEIDLLVFGTVGLGIFEDDDINRPVVYTPWEVHDMVIDEDVAGFVNTVGKKKFYSPQEAVDTFGIENVGKKTRSNYDKDVDEKVSITHVIKPRSLSKKSKGKKGNRNMPYMSLWYETATKKVVRESGFPEFPVPVVRYQKAINEKFGRSAAMSIISDTVELNTVQFNLTNAIEKIANPPMAVQQGAIGYGDVLDLSPGGITVYQQSLMNATGNKPINTIHDIGDLQWVDKFKEDLKGNIKEGFMLDRLLDLSDKTQKTLGEVLLQDKIRGTSLSSVFVRQITELFSPTIKRTHNILLRKGYFGTYEDNFPVVPGVTVVIPQVVADRISTSLDLYEIQFTCPAKSIVQTEELQGIVTAVGYMEASPFLQEGMDQLDADKITKRISQLSRFGEGLYASEDAVKKKREDRAKQQQFVQQVELAKIQGEVNRNNATAEQQKAQADATTRGANGQII